MRFNYNPLVLLAVILILPPLSYAIDPPMLSPLNNPGSCSLNPQLNWNPSLDADFYQVEIYAVLNGAEYRIIAFETEDIQMKVPDGYLSTATTYQYRVRAVEQKEDKEDFSEWSPWMTFTTQKLIPAEKRCPADDDCDGITNEMEDQIQTSPTFKTLFVRPKKENGEDQYRFWEEFNRDIFPTKAGGRAVIPALDLAGVEVVIIGDQKNPYEPMRNFDYDPKYDTNNPPCHIMEIICHETRRSSGSPVVCEYAGDSSRKGHTWMDSGWIENKFAYFWTWCTLGFTAAKKTAYHIPEIYPLPIDRYFEEGAYKCIEVGRKPDVESCSRDSTKCQAISPYNFSDQPDDSCIKPPADTVAFNAVSLKSDGEIDGIGEKGVKSNKNRVLAKIVIHEMGHAFLSANNEDHCSNPWCIMFERTLDWNQRLFGPMILKKESLINEPTCPHSHGGGKDIRTQCFNGKSPKQ